MGKARLPKNSAALITFLIVVRILSAFYNLIYDCDETYNYWEPGHYLIYGNGYMTWEYSPIYALRSYLYLWIHMWPSFILSFIFANKTILFYLIRLTTACFSIFCELYFCIGLSKNAGSGVSRYCMVFLAMSSGTYFASTTFLPNTLSMHLTMISFGAWFCDHYKMTIFSAGISILVGWPYAALAYSVIAIFILMKRRKLLYFIMFSLVYGLMIVVPLIIVDSYYYGRLVITPINAIIYNVFNSKAGPELYGVEPPSYYITNLFLNFNLVLVASFFSLPMLILSKILVSTRKHKMLESCHCLCISTLLVWLLVFSLQSHKEERFMYPIYPLICASAAFTTKLIEQFVVGTRKTYSLPVFKVIVILCCVTFSGLSLSRVISVRQGFRATFQAFTDLKEDDNSGLYEPLILMTNSSYDRSVNICLGKEWYRYPTSFFLPTSKDYRMRFINSEFNGQLPKLYEPYSEEIGLQTRLVHSDFNDMNLKENSRFIDVKKCHYLIDSSNIFPTEKEPDYAKNLSDWTLVSSHKILDLDRSPPILRSFFIPFTSYHVNAYKDYNLLRNNQLFKKVEATQ